MPMNCGALSMYMGSSEITYRVSQLVLVRIVSSLDMIGLDSPTKDTIHGYQPVHVAQSVGSPIDDLTSMGCNRRVLRLNLV